MRRRDRDELSYREVTGWRRRPRVRRNDEADVSNDWKSMGGKFPSIGKLWRDDFQ